MLGTKKRTTTEPTLPNLDLRQFPSFASASDKLDSLRTELAQLDGRIATLRDDVTDSPEVAELRATKARHEHELKTVREQMAADTAKYNSSKDETVRGGLHNRLVASEKRARALAGAIHADTAAIATQLAKPRLSLDALRYIDAERADRISSAEIELAASETRRAGLVEAIAVVTKQADAARAAALHQLRQELEAPQAVLHERLCAALRELHLAGEALAKFNCAASNGGIALSPKLPAQWGNFREMSKAWLAGDSCVWWSTNNIHGNPAQF